MINYALRTNKRIVQDKIYRNVLNKNIVGLLGPSCENYVNLLSSYGFKNMIFFERDRKVFLKQIISNIKINYVLKFDNILNNLNENAFYDIDLMCSVYSIEDMLPEIAKLKEFSLTLCIRPCGRENTINILKKYIAKFEVYDYTDKTPMLTILKK